MQTTGLTQTTVFEKRPADRDEKIGDAALSKLQ